ncbi:MAG: acyl carrier protein [Fimbriimonadaceae bacterium]|nr:acyl carrier protein [Fimbriimonadaceae bacterium]
MADNVFEKVKKIVCEELGVQESEVKAESSFTEDLGADSLDIVELVMAVEAQFSIDVPDDDAANIKTVGDVVAYIEKLTS